MHNSFFFFYHLLSEPRSLAFLKIFFIYSPLIRSSKINYHDCPTLINSSQIATTITCKIAATHFLLWKAHVVPILWGMKHFCYLDWIVVIQVAKIIVRTGDAARENDNPTNEFWFTQDQDILGSLLSFVAEEVLLNSTNEFWFTIFS